MKILVTGGAGFIGSHLVDALIELGHEVCIFDNLTTGEMDNVNKKAIFELGNIDSEYEISECFEQFRPEIVFHLAGQTSVPFGEENPEVDMEWNYKGMINMINMGKRYAIKKLVFSSTCAVYGNAIELPIKETAIVSPLNYYGVSKLSAERILEISTLDYTIFRFANVYGERQKGGVVPIFVCNALDGCKIPIEGQGIQTRDFIYVGDIVKACIKVIDNGNKRTYNLSTGIESNLFDILDCISKASEKKIEVEMISPRDADIAKSCLDSKRAKDELNWKYSTSLLEGIDKVVKYMK